MLAFAGGLAIRESKSTTTKLIRTAARSSALLLNPFLRWTQAPLAKLDKGGWASMGSKHFRLQKGHQPDLIMFPAVVKSTVSSVTSGAALHFTGA